jgi:carboxyl-terminal processing protease
MGSTAFRRVVLGILVIVLVAGVALWGKKRHVASHPDDKAYLQLFREVLVLVKKNYVEPVDDKKLQEKAINGMLAALDPHSAYMPPEPFKEMNIQISGSFGGVGIELSIKNDRLTVVSPIQDTPAFRAGIKSGDHIAMINEKSTRGMRIEDAVKLMRGQEGTRVTLTIVREGSPKPLVFPLVRAIIRVTSLKYRSLEPGYGYIRLQQFQERTDEDFGKALDKLKEQNGGTLKGLVVDLRYNPGGLVDVAVKVAGRFVGEKLNEDGTIVSTKGREPGSSRTLYANVGGKEPHYPLVVLINGGSASASEILAGALQDHKRAVIMGTQSFGKGSVQSVLPLKGGAGLKITTAKYYTPKGRSIQAVGITPDIMVGRVDPASLVKKTEKSVHEKDLDNHIANGNGSDSPKEGAPEKQKQPEPPKPAPGGKMPPHEPMPLGDEDTAKDYQLSRALELLKGVETMRQLAQPQK